MFGIEIIDASLLPALIVAFFAGLISFLSPCVLPIVPPYLAYMSGVALNDVDNKKGRQKIVFTALFFGFRTINRIYFSWIFSISYRYSFF